MKKLNPNDESDIQDRAKSREIVQVVLDYGINQKQLYHMIYLLAMELESVEHMKLITSLINKFKSPSEDNKKTGLITGEQQ